MSFLYNLTHKVSSVTFRIYFKKVQYSGLENIPLDKPILVAANHPTAFIEPVLLAITLPIELNFITRGDVFAKPFYRRILENLHMIPIFRFRDGFSNMKSNMATMDYVYQALSERKKILIFVEGTTQTSWRIRPMQKGMARMAFGNFERFGDLDLQVLPVGLTYENPHQWRTEVCINVGKPIALRDYYETHAQNPNAAINHLTREVGERLKPLVVHLDRPENDGLAAKFFNLYRNSFPLEVFPIFQNSKRRLMAQQEIAENINKAEPEKIADWEQKMTDYETQLAAHGVEDLGVAQPYHDRFRNKLGLILGGIPFALGAAVHYPIRWYAEHVRRTRVKDSLEFQGPVVFGIKTFLTLILYFVLFILALIINNLAVWVTILLLPFLAFYAVLYRDFFLRVRAAQRFNKLPSDTGGGLFELRKSLLESVRGR